MQKKPLRFFLHYFLSEGRRKEVKTLNGYSYLTLEQRREIERMYAEGERVVDIAARLKRSAAAIYEELKRGYTGEFDGYARPKYSADLAQATVQENFRRRGNRRGANCRKHEGRFNMSGTTVKWAIGDCDSTDKTTSFAPVPSCASLCTHRLSFPELQGGLRIGGWTI